MKIKSFKFYILTWVFTILAFTLSANAQDVQFNRYHTQDEINQYMRTVAEKNPTFVFFHNLGKSAQGREISYVVISKGDPQKLPAIYFNGTHHGDEWSSTESILALVDYLIQHNADADISTLLGGYAIYLQPLVNPDGHFAKTREDSFGDDPNRDYSSPTQAEAESFRVKEIQLVKSLVDQIHPRAAAAYHSGIEEILWSWCFTQQAPPNQKVLASLGELTAQAMQFDRYLQSYNDYQTNGEFIDYAAMKYGTLAFTFEVSDAKTPRPADLEAVVQRSILGAVSFMKGVQALDQHAFYYSLVSPTGSYGKKRKVWSGTRLE